MVSSFLPSSHQPYIILSHDLTASRCNRNWIVYQRLTYSQLLPLLIESTQKKTNITNEDYL